MGLISRGGHLWCSRAMYTWAQWGVHLHWVCEYFSIGYTGFVQQGSVHLGLISRGGHLWCSRAMYTWAQWGVHLHWVCEYFSIAYTGLVQQGSTLGVNLWGRASSFLNRFYCFCVVGHCTLGLDQKETDSVVLQGYVHLGSMRQSISTGYVNISQQVLLVCCSRILYTWGSLVGEDISGVVGFCTLGLNQQGGHLISQYSLLVWCSSTLHLGSISGGGPPHFLIGYTGFVQQVTVHFSLISRRQTLWGCRAMYTWAQGGGPLALGM